MILRSRVGDANGLCNHTGVPELASRQAGPNRLSSAVMCVTTSGELLPLQRSQYRISRIESAKSRQSRSHVIVSCDRLASDSSRVRLGTPLR